MAQTEIGNHSPSDVIVTGTQKLANERFQIAQDYADQTFESALALPLLFASFLN